MPTLACIRRFASLTYVLPGRRSRRQRGSRCRSRTPLPQLPCCRRGTRGGHTAPRVPRIEVGDRAVGAGLASRGPSWSTPATKAGTTCHQHGARVQGAGPPGNDIRTRWTALSFWPTRQPLSASNEDPKHAKSSSVVESLDAPLRRRRARRSCAVVGLLRCRSVPRHLDPPAAESFHSKTLGVLDQGRVAARVDVGEVSRTVVSTSRVVWSMRGQKGIRAPPPALQMCQLRADRPECTRCCRLAGAARSTASAAC